MDVVDAAGSFGKVADGTWGAVGTSDILGAGQRLIAEMRSTTGQGRPDSGETFALGATSFLGAVQTLEQAYPGSGWEGSGAQSYTGATRRVAGAAEALAVLDRNVHTVIDREATQIVRRREALDDHADHLSSLRRVTGSLAAIPGVGPAMQRSIELAAVTAAVSVCGTELHDLAAETADNASRLRRIAGDYEALIDQAPPDGAAPPDEDAPTEPAAETAPTDEAAAPRELPQPGASGSVPISSPPMCPAPAPASAAAEQSPMQGDLMSGLTSAFGAVGGMIGAAVAPLAAVLSGVVSAAGQLPSLASQSSTPQTPQVDLTKDPKDTDTPEADSAGKSDDRPAAADDDLADAEGAAPPETPAPPERAPSPPPSPLAPAATRPPQ
ncbi:MAG: EspA/EspE family type VII secretion system effector [Mycobacterium kyogaense]|uniref:EspA/EspE family type VII secretion system effector n=1 Tax=Mycobacterium kyogaense TaxID=2212479 RepID=UPI002FF5C9CF